MPGAKRNIARDPGAFLSQLDRQITTAKRTLEEQERFVKGLQTARECVANEVLTNALNGNGKHRQRQSTYNGNGSRVQMVKTILENAPGPVTVDEIMTEMARHGHVDDKRYVHSTLSYLKRTSQVKNPERGRWVAATSQKAKAA